MLKQTGDTIRATASDSESTEWSERVERSRGGLDSVGTFAQGVISSDPLIDLASFEWIGISMQTWHAQT